MGRQQREEMLDDSWFTVNEQLQRLRSSWRLRCMVGVRPEVRSPKSAPGDRREDDSLNDSWFH